MDASERLIPFWEEDQTSIMDVTTGERYDAFERHSPTEFVASRTWWNSNLVMDNFLPRLMPSFPDEVETANELYALFARRFVQRNTTHDAPMRRGVLLTHGLVVELVSYGYIGSFIKRPEGDFDFLLGAGAPNDTHEKASYADPAQTSIVRVPGYTYWNGERYV